MRLERFSRAIKMMGIKGTGFPSNTAIRLFSANCSKISQRLDILVHPNNLRHGKEDIHKTHTIMESRMR